MLCRGVCVRTRMYMCQSDLVESEGLMMWEGGDTYLVEPSP